MPDPITGTIAAVASVGSSIIAANISAEQFIGMSGSGFAIGLGIATYEWIASLILIVVAKFFLPVFIQKKIFTMPQFLALRYDNRIKTILAIFWISLFVFVNLTSILYLGALTLKSIFGIKLIYGIIGLAVFSLLYTILNGLKAIASTDIMAADAISSRIMNHDINSVKHLTMGYDMGLGEIHENAIEIIGETLDNLHIEWRHARLKG